MQKSQPKTTAIAVNPEAAAAEKVTYFLTIK